MSCSIDHKKADNVMPSRHRHVQGGREDFVQVILHARFQACSFAPRARMRFQDRRAEYIQARAGQRDRMSAIPPDAVDEKDLYMI